MASNKLAVSCILEIPNETASDANPLMSARMLWAPSIDSIGALTSLKKASNGSVIKPRLGISLMYLFASLANKGIKIRKNNRIKVIDYERYNNAYSLWHSNFRQIYMKRSK